MYHLKGVVFGDVFCETMVTCLMCAHTVYSTNAIETMCGCIRTCKFLGSTEGVSYSHNNLIQSSVMSIMQTQLPPVCEVLIFRIFLL